MMGGRSDEPPGNIPSTVVAAHEAPGSAIAVKQGELDTAAAFANDEWVPFARASQVVSTSMFDGVLPARQDLKILCPVVGLDAIAVVDNLTSSQGSTEDFRGDQAVFVDVAPTVGQWMFRSPHQHVAVRGNAPPALPVVVRRSACPIHHRLSVANRGEQVCRAR